ncbi:MAG TPA: hypothetical protein VFD30_02875 [Terriglobia bacterium]|jgi:hypothetical protein|nr:hypothetical protein [Terriglobia bacterium]
MARIALVVLWLAAFLCILIPPAVANEAVVTDEAKSSSQKSSALNRAAEEFKVLTRDLGMRPESPPATKQQLRHKLLWHGRVYENFRNDVLDAIPHEVIQNHQSKSPLRRNQFGFNVAGPIIIPHLTKNGSNTFFMLSYEGVREHITRASLHTVPTVAQRAGDFSQTVDQAGNPLPIFDPATTVPNPAYNPNLPVSTTNLQYLRSRFPGNIIPPDRIAKNMEEVLSLYPLPNTDVGPFFQNNYFVNAPETDTADGIIVKVDHQFGDRHRLTSNTVISRGFLGPAKYFPNYASPTAPDRNFSNWRSELDYVYTPNANTVNSASFGVSSDQVQAGDGVQTPFPRYLLENYPSMGIGYPTSSYLAMGTGYPNSRNARNAVTIRDHVTSRKGKHSLRLELEANFQQVNSFSPQYPSGFFEFSAGLTSLPGIINTGDSFASFLLGLPQYGERTITTAPSYFRNSYQSVGAGDKYELSKNLTVDIGLDLSRRSPRVEKYNRQSTVDPSAIDPSSGLRGALVFAGRGGIPRGLRPSNIDIDPSLGIVWNPRGNARTVVRASYYRYHGQIPIYNGQWGTQGFNARQTFISANTQLSPALDLANGIPPYTTPLPDISPSAAVNTVADYVDLTGHEPVYQSASLTVEREVPFSLVVSMGTNYSWGRDLLVGDSAANPNAINPKYMSYGDALYNEDFRVTLQPYPQYKGFELYGLYPAGHYQRNSLFVRAEKRASFGLTFTAYYEFSKQLDDYSGPYGNQDFFNSRNNWALTSYNTPQYIQLSYIYELPFGSDKPLLRFSDWRGSLVRGWSISGTAYWNDGRPLALHPEFNNTGGVLTTLNVDEVAGVDRHVPSPGPSLWYNPAAFVQPPDFTMGDVSRTLPDLLGPGFNSMDLSVNKRIHVSSDLALEFNASAFNFLNHANWNYPDPNIGPANAPNVNAGKIIGSHGGRVIQIGLKFSF